MNKDDFEIISAKETKAILGSNCEYALIDVREEGIFCVCHQLLAINMPLSRLELMCGNLVPCRNTRIIIVDGGPKDPQQLGVRAAQRLRELGYSHISLMRGGMEEWIAEGYKAFAGVFVPSKAFGEFVEHTMGTPRLEPEVVKTMLEVGTRMVILDSRPNNEYRRMNIPAGINVPGGELVYHIEDYAADPSLFVVVNCAGRTRSIIGCQSLRNAGIRNNVVALKGGTMGWELAGLEPERGTLDRYSVEPPSPRALEVARARAAAVAERYNVRFVTRDMLDVWRGERNERNLYILDVRQPVEFEAGHMPDSINVQGVTIVQSTDTCVGVRNGRVVLADDTEVRAIMAASWLNQMGYPEVYVLRGGIHGELRCGTEKPVLLGNPYGTPITPRELNTEQKSDAPPLILDLGISRESRKGHIPGACWGTRACLGMAREQFPDARNIVLACGAGPLSLVACEDARRLWPDARVRYVEGGTRAWIAQGLPVSKGLDCRFSPENDVYNRPYERQHLSKEEEREAMFQYLSWEEGLIDEVLSDGDLHFNIR